MITEIAIFRIQPGKAAEFEAGWRKSAAALAGSGSGFISHRFGPKYEEKDVYLLEVEWTDHEAHMAFRASPAFPDFRANFAPFLAGPPEMFHFTPWT